MFLCLSKPNVKKSVLGLHSAFRRFIYISKYYIKMILKTVAKTCKGVLKMDMTLVTRVKVKSNNKTVIDFNSGRNKDL